MLRRFGGETIHLHSSEYARTPLPRLLFGFRDLRALRQRERDIDVHHVYNPDPYPFPYLRFLKKPIVYTLSAGLRRTARIPAAFFSRHVACTIVSDETDLKRLRAGGVHNGRIAPVGIDAARFHVEPIDLGETLTLMSGSAPWTRSQFETKGVDALLDAATRDARLRLIFLWRGHWLDEMRARIERRGLRDRVEIIDDVVDVDRILARSHAAIVLAKDLSAIKAYPHSLLESLAAGKPVLVSRGIPLADWVEREGCGVVVDRVEPDMIDEALAALRIDYRRWQANARRVGPGAFPIEATLNAYGEVYQQIASRGKST